MEELLTWSWFVCLTLAAGFDWKSRELPCWLFCVWLVPALANLFLTGPGHHLGGAAAGMLLLILAWATHGEIGEGDGLFFLLSACFLETGQIALLFLGSLGISALWSMVLVLRAHMSGTGKATGTVPFITCAWPVGAWLMWAGR